MSTDTSTTDDTKQWEYGESRNRLPLMDLRGGPRIWSVTVHERLQAMLPGEYTDFRVGDADREYIAVTRVDSEHWRAVHLSERKVYEGTITHKVGRFITSWVTA